MIDEFLTLDDDGKQATKCDCNHVLVLNLRVQSIVSPFILHPSSLNIGTWIRAGVALVLGAILASCKVGPDYARPSLEMPGAYKSASEQEAAESGLERDWWRMFQDPELNALEEEAQRANYSIEAAMARVAEARASAAAVKSAFFPVVTMNPSAVRSRRPAPATSSNSTSGKAAQITSLANAVSKLLASAAAVSRPSTTGTTTGSTTGTSLSTGAGSQSLTSNAATTPSATTSNLFQIPFDLSYEIDFWGRVRRSYEAARAQTRVSVYDLEVVRQTIVADVAQDYFTLRALDSQDQIFERNLGLYRDEVDLTERQFKAGLVNEANVAQATVQLESTRVQQLEIRRQRADLEHAIAVLLGRPPAGLSVTVRALDAIPPVLPAGTPAEVLRRRPDVAEAEQNLAAACAQIGVAEANFFPVVKLTGLGGFQSPQIQHTLDWQNRIWSFGPNAALPIFQGGQLRANLRQAKARYDEFQATYRGTVLTAFSDVENSLTDLHMRADEADAQDRALTAARDYLELTQAQYQNGIVNYLQVIDAERALLTNELSAAQILNERMVSTVLLIKALGGGWDAQESASSARGDGAEPTRTISEEK